MASAPVTTGAPTRAPAIDRRKLLGALAAAPLFAAVPLPAPDPLEALFSIWKASINSINHDDLSEAAEDAMWDRLVAAEEQIVRSTATGPRIAAMRLWIGLEHVTTSTADCDAVVREDVGTLVRNGDGHDWHVKCMMHALQALIGNGAQP